MLRLYLHKSIVPNRNLWYLFSLRNKRDAALSWIATSTIAVEGVLFQRRPTEHVEIIGQSLNKRLCKKPKFLMHRLTINTQRIINTAHWTNEFKI